MTAIEWLENKINDELEIYNNQWLLIENFIEQAKIIEKQQQDEFAIGFAEWCDETTTQVSKGEWGNWLPIAKYCLSTKELLEIYKKLSIKELLEIYKKTL